MTMDRKALIDRLTPEQQVIARAAIGNGLAFDIDTTGTLSAEAVEDFFNEVKGMLPRKLYLVRFDLYVTQYMGEEEVIPNQLRIVWAISEEEAEKKVEDAYPSDEYAVYRRVSVTSTTVAID